MRNVLLIGLAIVALAIPAQAQGRFRGDDGEGRGQGDRIGQRGERGERGGPRGRGGRGRMSPMRMVRMLPNRLEMSEDQRQVYGEIVESFRTQWIENRPDPEQMRALHESFRAARESGDDELATQIREQMREQMRGMRESGRHVVDSFLSEVETILEDHQVVQLRELRTQFEQRMQQRREQRNMREVIQRLPDELDMTEEQRAQFDQIVQNQRERMQQRREQWRELQPLVEQMREARRNGDEQLAAELQAEIEARRPERGRPQDILDQLMPILTDAQKAKLEQLRSQHAPREEGPRDVRRVLQAAKRLDLTKDQEEQIRQIIREVQQVRSKGRLGDGDKADLAQTVKDEIAKVLTADQKNQFERLLEQDGRRGRDRSDREGRRGRGGLRGQGRG